MRMLLPLLLTMVLGCSNGHVPRSPKQQFAEDLHQYHQVVTEAWAYLESKRKLSNVDVTAARDRLLARLTDQTTREEFAWMLQEFAAALEDGHSQVDTLQLRPPPPNTWPIGFACVKEGVIVGNLNWLPNNPGVQPGDRLLRVDGQPIEEVIQRQMAFTSASTIHARRVLAVDQIHWTEASQVSFSLERDADTVLEVTLPCLTHRLDYRFRQREAFCTYARLDQDLGLIRIPQFTWNETDFRAAATDAAREAALGEAKSQIDGVFQAAEGAKGLILDLRGNSGGFELLSSYVAEHLVEGDFLYYTSTRHDTAFVRSMEAYRGLDPSYFGRPIPQHPRRWLGFRHFAGRPFAGRLVVLINARCFSTTDNLCAFLQDARPNTQFVGTATGGGTGEPMKVTTLPHSGADVSFCVSLIHSPHGRLIEGNGTQPDLEVEPTREDAKQRRDAVLEAAKSLFLKE